MVMISDGRGEDTLSFLKRLIKAIQGMDGSFT